MVEVRRLPLSCVLRRAVHHSRLSGVSSRLKLDAFDAVTVADIALALETEEKLARLDSNGLTALHRRRLRLPWNVAALGSISVGHAPALKK